MKKIMKKALVLLAAIGVLSLMLMLAASAAADTTLYTQGDIEWTIDTSTGIVTVHPTAEATGKAHFEDAKAGEWKTFCQTYADSITKIVIENIDNREPITAITGGFSGPKKLTTIVFPKTVTAIGSRNGGYAFSSASITTIGPDGTPEGTCDLSIITEPWSDTSHVGTFTRTACKNFILPNIASNIVTSMFRAVDGFEEITIPENVLEIKSSAFYLCAGLKKVTVKGSATVVAHDAFVDCKNLTTIVGHKDSSAYEYAKNNGYEFVDINTNEVIIAANKGEDKVDSDEPVNGLYTQGNIEWTFDEKTGVVTVHPTANATGVAHFEDSKDGAWKTFCKTTHVDVMKKVIIENVEGRAPITKITGGIVGGAKFTTIIFPKTVTAIGSRSGGYAFSCKTLTTIGPEGTPEGTCDFSMITEPWGDYGHGSMFTNTSCKNYILPNIASNIVSYMFRAADGFKEITIPENVTGIKTNAFYLCKRLNKITIAGAATNVALDAFNGCTRMFTIVGHKNSSAYECAKKNGYEFIDINTGEKLLEGTVEIGMDPDVVFPWTREDADDGGNLTEEYMGKNTVYTYWAWYESEKTLVFFDNRPTGYNETGSQSAASDSGTHWMDYKDVIEKVVIENGIDTIKSGAFQDLTNLKYVQLGGQSEMHSYAFLNCTGLVSIYRAYTEPQEGVADLTTFSKIWGGTLRNSGIHTVILRNGIEDINVSALYGVKNIVSEPTEFLIQFCKDNGFNLINVNNPDEIWEYYIYIDPANLIQAGSNAMCSFDAETGTLTVIGSGETFDISNYYGGGSKKQPWFSFRKEIKKIVFGPQITKIGKYSFCQCVNLEVIELPDSAIEISNAAFEKCYNLKAIYRTGNEPIEGTFDLSKATAVQPFAFAYNYLLVNFMISEDVLELDPSSFEDCMNMTAIYGTPGSYAESYAAENGKTFVDISTGMPAAATATPPEMNQDEKERAARDEEKNSDKEPIFTDPVLEPITNAPESETTPDDSIEVPDQTANGDVGIVVIIAVAAAVFIAVAVAVVLVIKKKKKA